MRLGIVGAGLAGLSCAWHALQEGFEVTLFDKSGIGGGASGVSVGLMHPFPGKTASLSLRAEEGMRATKELLKISQFLLGKPVASYTGIFRPAVTEQQKIDFQKQQHPDAEWTQVSCPGLLAREGLWIAGGVTVFPHLYMQGLWKGCEEMGATLIREPFVENSYFDKVILAAGSEILQFPECKNLSLRTALGQTLLCKSERPLPFSLASHGYIALTEDPHICQIGSTYEHTKDPNPTKVAELVDKVSLFYPEAKNLEVLKVRSGVRIAPREGHLPVLEQVSKNTWVFTGLGSRGLLYHALFGQELVRAL